ncbi:unnamed protein product [Pleuronectes platessa]|uniref:Uncharacterized protein n=1 Tax=Pleuronectes platessa TaxID=8262 RepID=A0A9N7TIC0_PLEPL|nr:unnamed protein product [Pleuronectes platessa]
MRERNDPTIKETVKRMLRTSPLYRKTQSSNGCQKFSSERQFFSREAVQVCLSSTVPPAASAPDANLMSPSHQAADLD